MWGQSIRKGEEREGVEKGQGQKKTLPFQGKGLTKKESAATYSPTKLPWQYHRR
jgi:hypothetical protein